MIESLGIIGTVLAVAGTLLNNQRRRACFYIWIAANLLTVWIHVDAGIWSLAARDAIFIAPAVDGLRRWRKADQEFIVHTSDIGERE
jgi:nicotinamide riboside transporter PnuC